MGCALVEAQVHKSTRVLGKIILRIQSSSSVNRELMDRNSGVAAQRMFLASLFFKPREAKARLGWCFPEHCVSCHLADRWAVLESVTGATAEQPEILGF